MPDDARRPRDLTTFGRQLASIGRIDKCQGCSCYVDTVREYRELLRREGIPEDDALVRRAQDLVQNHPATHGCLGCDPCYPVAVSNRIFERAGVREERGQALPVLGGAHAEHTILEPVAWPLFPGEYVVGNIRASVALSTLGSRDLIPKIVDAFGLRQIAIVGRTETENLGVEKVVRNVVANPSLRALVLCGAEAEGHRPGATLLALARNGMDADGRVVGSPGRRPILRNTSAAEVARFREQVAMVDLIGVQDLSAIRERVEKEATKTRPALGPWGGIGPAPIEEAGDPLPWVPDPKGYFVVSVDRPGARIILEFYAYDGRFVGALWSPSGKPLYHATIGRGWLSRLDHAAYLGRELTRAERALETGAQYVQDAA